MNVPELSSGSDDVDIVADAKRDNRLVVTVELSGAGLPGAEANFTVDTTSSSASAAAHESPSEMPPAPLIRTTAPQDGVSVVTP